MPARAADLKANMKKLMKGRMPGILLLAAALLTAWLGGLAPCGAELELRDRERDARIASWPIQAGDELSLEIEHSFEHIPWYEFYTVTDEGTFNLDRIAVAGYGAGIPAEMDVPTRIEDGLVWMEEINSVFPTLHWITSSKYMKTFTLNGEKIFDFRSLPDASRVSARIITTRGYFFRG